MSHLLGGICVAVILSAGGHALAQSQPPAQPPATPPPATEPPATQPPATQPTPPAARPQSDRPTLPGTQEARAQQVTIVGCVQREADYRSAHNLGKGGAVGTGVGVRNEFVLINASSRTAEPRMPEGTTGTPPATAPPATGTTGSTETGATPTTMPEGTDAFELTGEKESQAAGFVGRRVEIVGTMKAAETGPTGTTGGVTAGRPPTGVDTVSPDLKLREIEVMSVREVQGNCPAMR